MNKKIKVKCICGNDLNEDKALNNKPLKKGEFLVFYCKNCLPKQYSVNIRLLEEKTEKSQLITGRGIIFDNKEEATKLWNTLFDLFDIISDLREK